MKDLYIKEVLKEANKAYKIKEIPVGAIIIKDNTIIARAYNKKEKNNSCLDHAELIAIKQASKKLNNWRLDDCIMLVTLEPCPMCASAIKQSRISKVIYMKDNDNKNVSKITKNILEMQDNNRKVVLEKITSDEYDLLWKNFFESLRK